MSIRKPRIKNVALMPMGFESLQRAKKIAKLLHCRIAKVIVRDRRKDKGIKGLRYLVYMYPNKPTKKPRRKLTFDEEKTLFDAGFK